MPQDHDKHRTPATGSSNKSQPSIPRSSTISPLILILLDSFKVIFIRNPKLFLIIYTLGALPLSLLITSLSLSSTPRKLRSHIVHLEWLFNVVGNWVEAGNVKETAHLEVKELFAFQLLHALPVLLFSLFTVVATVTTITGRKRRLTLIASLRINWGRPLLTCVVSAVFWLVSGHVFPILITVIGYPRAVVVLVVTVIAEIYVMAVFSLALVVSVAEEWAGMDAILVGWGLMKGRRVSGWVLSGLILMGSNWIGREMVGVLEGQDWMGGNKWTAEMRMGYMVGLVVLLGWVVMWSYVVVTLYYCDCRKRHPVIRDHDDHHHPLDADIQI